jgi:hypothetical protein
MEQPLLEFAFEIRADVTGGKIPEVGATAKGMKRAVPIIGGTFEGPDIKGSIVPGGYDWQLVRTDGTTELEARYLLKTDDNVLITIVNAGLRHGSKDAMQRMADGKEVPPGEYYFRTTPRFEVGSGKYDWLANHIFIANGIRKPEQVLIQIWKVL